MMQIEKALLAKLKLYIEQFYGKTPEEQQKNKVECWFDFIDIVALPLGALTGVVSQLLLLRTCPAL